LGGVHKNCREKSGDRDVQTGKIGALRQRLLEGMGFQIQFRAIQMQVNLKSMVKSPLGVTVGF